MILIRILFVILLIIGIFKVIDVFSTTFKKEKKKPLTEEEIFEEMKKRTLEEKINSVDKKGKHKDIYL